MRTWGRIIGEVMLAAVLLAPGGAGAAETAAPAVPPITSLQEYFSAASDAGDNGKCDTAIPMFEKLAVDPRVKPGSLPAAAISVRHGRCLLPGDERARGVAMIMAGLPTLEAAGASFADEVGMTQMMLGLAAFHVYDHDTAVMWLTRAMAASDRSTRLQAAMRLAQTKLFDGDGAALQIIDKALAEIGEEKRTDKETRANFLSVRGRALMNLGRDKEAVADLRRALALSGGLTTKTSLSDVAVRADLAQAVLLIGDRDKAREYLAHTGAGRIKESPFGTATYMGVPACTGEPGLRPEDSAVVEYSIGPDGQVSNAQTVYSRGTYAAATAFAKEVRDWTWKPESIAKLPAFYRYLTRVELRCSNASGRADSVMAPLSRRLMDWAKPLAGFGESDAQAPKSDAVNFAQMSPIQVVKWLRGHAAERAAAGEKRAAGATLAIAAKHDPTKTERTRQDIAQAIALIDEADPRRAETGTVPALAALRAFAAIETRDIEGSRSKREQNRESVLRSALEDPMIAADALAQNTLRTLLATVRQVESFGPEQTDLLRAVADDTRLEEGHPLRQIALLRLASVAAATKQFQEAQTLFARTGLTEQQCSLIGDIPKLKSDGASSDDYPKDALYMDFEGWVKLEFDIDAGGRTANQRALIAYPPFVFVDAAKSLARGIRYDATYRPSGQLACSATSETVSFVIPSNH